MEERPGYMDDPDIEENAKHYSIVDYITYREYNKLQAIAPPSREQRLVPNDSKDRRPSSRAKK